MLKIRRQADFCEDAKKLIAEMKRQLAEKDEQLAQKDKLFNEKDGVREFLLILISCYILLCCSFLV